MTRRISFGVSRLNGEYFCTVRRAVMTRSGELRLWFEVVGDMSSGELSDPALSTLGLSRQAATSGTEGGVDAETRAYQPLRVDLTEANPHQRIVGSAMFEGIATSDLVFFRYGGGYSSCPVAVEQVSGLSQIESSVLPVCVSRYNDAYFCTVLRATITSKGEAHLEFIVIGDMSMGELQSPRCSKLSWHPTLESTWAFATPAEERLKWNDEQRRISGTLVYQGVPLEQDVWFAFGSAGYGRARVRFEALPSVVLTLSLSRGLCDLLEISCTGMAGAQVALVNAVELEPEKSIAALRRLLAGRLNVQTGQITLIMSDGTLLGFEHDLRFLDDVFYVGPVA